MKFNNNRALKKVAEIAKKVSSGLQQDIKETKSSSPSLRQFSLQVEDKG